jgi:hypothetical protein
MLEIIHTDCAPTTRQLNVSAGVLQCNGRNVTCTQGVEERVSNPKTPFGQDGVQTNGAPSSAQGGSSVAGDPAQAHSLEHCLIRG